MPPTPSPRRPARPGTRGRGVLALVLASLALVGCRAGYVVKSAWFQAELLADRVPLDRALEAGTLPEEQARRLTLVPEIKAFGERLGLSPTRNYEAISPHWERVVYNFSACDASRFEPVTWWFPVVGRVPYLGFFRPQDAERHARRYGDRGYDVWVRTAGAWSTLGWFRDPVLPGMLRWDEWRLAETVLHELAHATLWIRGSVSFNESFASVVGEVAAARWMTHAYGPDSPEVAAMHRKQADGEIWEGILRGLFQDLDEAYRRLDDDRGERLVAKATILDTVEARARAAPFQDPAPYVEAARRGPWNNARLWQYRTYNEAREEFLQLLEQCNGDLPSFIEAVDRATRRAKDPFAALRAALDSPSPTPD